MKNELPRIEPSGILPQVPTGDSDTRQGSQITMLPDMPAVNMDGTPTAEGTKVAEIFRKLCKESIRRRSTEAQ